MLNYERFRKALKAYKNEKPLFEVTSEEKAVEEKLLSAIKTFSSELTVADIDIDLITFEDLCVMEDFSDYYNSTASSIYYKITSKIKHMERVNSNCSFI